MKITLYILFFLSHFSFGMNDFEKGIIKRNFTDYDSSIYYFNVALNKNDLQDITKAKILLERGKTYQLSQHYDLALLDFNTGLSLFEKHSNVNGIALGSIYLAEFYRHLGKLNKSEAIIIKVENSINKIDILPKTKALFYNRCAAILAETGSEGEEGVIVNSNHAIEISQQYGFKTIEASSLNQLAYLQFNKRNKNAIFLYEQALAIYDSLNDLRSQVHIMANIARFYQINGDYEKGLEYCNTGIDILKGKEWFRELSEIYDLKATCLHYLGRFEEAYNISNERMYANGNFLLAQNDKKLKELETKYSVEQKDKQILLEQEKTKISKQETKQKKKELQSYILMSFLLATILLIALFAYYKIRKSNKLLNKSIEQKEILLQEVHHRVKNNLTVLNSLLYIQADETSNEEAKIILNECQSRIQSMALVHQNLYDVEDASQVNLSHFMEQLLHESNEIFGLKAFQVKHVIDVSNIHFDMSFTVFLGLIINEFLTNSFKYAFDENRENLVQINLEKNNENFILKYSDSGAGLPKDFDIDQSGGFGFKLIKIMINQIHGKFDYNKKSNIFTIKFKKIQ